MSESEYIEVEEAVDRIYRILPKRTDSDYQRGIAVGMSLAKIAIEEVPTVDAVEVVRCRNCRWYVVNELTKKYEIDKRRKPSFCELYGRYREENWFCADGERREE